MGFLFGGHNTTTRADKIADFKVNTAKYGEPVAEILGTTRVSGNVIYYDDFTAIEHRETQRTGKGGGSKHTNITYTYTVACIVGLCEGPIAGLGRVWKNKEIYKYPSSEIGMTLFDGREGQKPWAYTQSKHPEKALAYKGLAYMAGVVDLGSSGSLPNYNFEVRGKLLDTGDGVDVNPADYIRYVLDRIGLKDQQIEGLENYRQYCKASDMLISSPSDSGAKSARDIINDIAQITNAYVFWSNDRFKIVPVSDQAYNGWTPDREIKYALTEDDFLPQSGGRLVEYQRKDSSSAHNQITVEFTNREHAYEKESVSYELTEDIKRTGLRSGSPISAPYLYTKKRAVRYAEQIARLQFYGRNKYTFKLDWAFCRLEPGDLVTLTDSSCGISEQPAIITGIVEDRQGLLTVTAISRAEGEYTAPVFDVHENDRPFIDYNQEPPPVTALSIFQPPVDLTQNGNEMWLGATAEEGWGGCNVWISDDNEKYKLLGTLSNRERGGSLVQAITETDTTATVKINAGELRSGTKQDAERGNTLCRIDGECLSYTTATLISKGTYRLEGLVRGQYGTTAVAHSDGAIFSRLDESLGRFTYKDDDVGKKIYLKCTSVNMFGGQEEDISTVKVFQYTIQPYYIPEVSNLSLHTRYHDLGRGAKSFDVVATFKTPALASFDTAEAWYREQGQEEWKYGGNGDGQIVISGCEIARTYDVKVQVKDIHGHVSQGVEKSILVEMKSEIPNAPQGFSLAIGEQAIFNWLEVTNADVDFYEIRTNDDAGATAGLVGKSNNTTLYGSLTNRKGKVYLYAHNPVKGYGPPAVLEYSFPTPKAPSLVEVGSRLGGLAVSFTTIPKDCRGANIYAGDQSFYVTGNSQFLALEAGVYEVSVAYVDIFGEGKRSGGKTATVKVKIDGSLIEAGTISMANVDKTVKEAIENGSAELKEQVVQIVGNLDDPEKIKQYSGIVQLNNAIELRVKSDEIISKINLSPETVTIDGKLINITGDTKFEKNVTANNIETGSLSADKLNVESLSAITATIGTLRTKESGARTEIKDNLIEVYDNNNKLRVRMGVW